MKISACWITKNEENNILRSIESLKDVVDEIVVVDTGSTDNTVNTAKSVGARIEFFEWTGDFSAAKNYAMSQITGEIVFFIDADEWFSPKLTTEDRVGIENTFLQNKLIDAIQLTIRNLNSQGAVKSTCAACRIIRNKPEIEFRGKIHEQLLKKNGGAPEVAVLDSWQINHCGYVDEILKSKMRRNIELLEASAINSPDPMERHFCHCYLVREYFQAGTDDGVRHLKLVLKEPDMIRRQCLKYDHGFAPLIYIMLFVATNEKARAQLSRKELHRKLVEPFRKYIRQYPGIATIELLYKCLFDIKEDVILSQIASAIEAARNIPYSPVSNYREAEMIINQRAAEASMRRGRLAEAMTYATESFKYTQNRNSSALYILLSCMRGIQVEEIIFFLNSQFDLNNPAWLEYLSVGTRLHGFQGVYAYYLDKKVKAGLATKGDYLYLMLLHGRYSESVEVSRKLCNEEMAGVVSQNIFLAAICSKDEQIYRDNADYLKDYKRVLDAYFAGGEINTFLERDFRILKDNYGLIAFATGLERADEFMEVFRAHALLCFQIRAEYCVENRLYVDLLAKPMPSLDDTLSNHYVIEALVYTGRYEEAFDKIEMLFRSGYVNSDLLKLLLAAADCSTGEMKRRLSAVYEKYTLHYDRFIDIQDILHTGYIVDDGNKRKAKAYKSLTPTQFNKQIEEDAEKPYISGFAELSEQVGGIYEDRGMVATAAECYRFSIAQGRNSDENRKKLAELFQVMGNKQLSAAINSMK